MNRHAFGIDPRQGATRFVFAALVALLLIPAIAVPRQTAAQDWSAPTTVYIPETGQILDGYFLDVWRAWGGSSAIGYPLTPEFEEDGHVVQYFQYARLEYWPDDPDGLVVHFGDIGTELKPLTVFRTAPSISGGAPLERQRLATEQQAWMPLDPAEHNLGNTADWRYVPETDHVVKFGFKTVWEQSGEEAFLGYPLTEEYIVDGITYQVFERGKLAWKPGAYVWFVPVGELLVRKYDLDTEPRPQGNIPIYDEALFVPPPPPEPEVIVPTGEKVDRDQPELAVHDGLARQHRHRRVVCQHRPSWFRYTARHVLRYVPRWIADDGRRHRR